MATQRRHCPPDVDVLGSDLGRAIVANAATTVLLRQSPQAIDGIAATFNLSEGQRQFLLTADRGQGLLGSGTEWVAFQALASPAEDVLVATDPEFLAGLQDSGANPDWVEP
ncbi:hypothetical protein ACIOD2_35965 [Amycolatopsis sp. NPDC088138]|uniref:hypothetical protein n=1 Tax=Amycolatopsis sp. NPDC088138 TaxID=3363938 RepID=UPI003815A1B2